MHLELEQNTPRTQHPQLVCCSYADFESGKPEDTITLQSGSKLTALTGGIFKGIIPVILYVSVYLQQILDILHHC